MIQYEIELLQRKLRSLQIEIERAHKFHALSNLWQKRTKSADWIRKHQAHLLVDESHIVANATKLEPLCGVYFLVGHSNQEGDFKRPCIVYVGQSRDIATRILSHRSRIPFWAYSVIECEEEHLDLLEAIYIQVYKPQFNRAVPALPLKGRGNTANAVNTAMAEEDRIDIELVREARAESDERIRFEAVRNDLNL